MASVLHIVEISTRRATALLMPQPENFCILVPPIDPSFPLNGVIFIGAREGRWAARL
jgi:hypothetical protein